MLPSAAFRIFMSSPAATSTRAPKSFLGLVSDRQRGLVELKGIVLVVELVISVVAVRVVVRRGDIAALGESRRGQHIGQRGIGRLGRLRGLVRDMPRPCIAEHQQCITAATTGRSCLLHVLFIPHAFNIVKSVIRRQNCPRTRWRAGATGLWRRAAITPLVRRGEKCPSLRAPVPP